MGGLCLANAKLGTVHGYASVLGGMFDSAPHGAICACLLPLVFQKSAEKLEELASAGDINAAVRLERFVEVSRIVTGNSKATVSEGIAWLNALVRDVGVPTLSNICIGLTLDYIDEIASATSIASSTKGNPVVLTNEELKTILRSAI